MRPRPFPVLIALLFLGTATPLAAQTTIDFDDLSGDSPGVIPDGYFGLQWNNFLWMNSSNMVYEGAIVSPYNVAVNTGEASSFSSAGTFTFNDVYVTTLWSPYTSIQVYGYLGATRVYSEALTFSDLSPLHAIFNWTGINRVEFTDVGELPPPIAIDNLTLSDRANMVVTPEPGSILLLATGLLGLALVARRQRKIA